MRLYHEEYRYRVVSVLIHPHDSRMVVVQDLREFKTAKAAHRLEKQWLAEGKSVLYQTAKVTWLTPDEYQAEVETLPKAAE